MYTFFKRYINICNIYYIKNTTFFFFLMNVKAMNVVTTIFELHVSEKRLIGTYHLLRSAVRNVL